MPEATPKIIHKTDPLSILSHHNGTKKSNWLARLELGFSTTNLDSISKTTLHHRKHTGPLRVQRPFYPESGASRHVCHLLVLHPPAGIASGDVLDVSVSLDPGTHAVLTTPGATKWYGGCARAEQHTRLTVSDHAVLEWLPQEAIVFNGAQTNTTTQINLSDSASVMAWDLTVFGRRASLEQFVLGQYRNAISITQDSQLLVHDLLDVSGSDRWFSSPLGLHDNHVMGTFWAICGQRESTMLDQDVEAMREMIIQHNYAVCVTRVEAVLIVRYVGTEIEVCFRQFCHLRALLRRRWFGYDEYFPRIWTT